MSRSLHWVRVTIMTMTIHMSRTSIMIMEKNNNNQQRVLVFRFFDIVKPFPIRYFEQQFSGGTGVVLDDIFAGLYTGLVLRLFF